MIKKLLILVAWALVGVVVGLVLAMTGIAVFTDMTFGEFVRLLVSLNPGEVFAAALSGVAALIVAVPVLALVHETGHLVCGLLSGYRFVSFRIFSFTVIRDHGHLRVKRFAISGTGGQCLLAPPDVPDGRIPTVWYNLGGVLANVAVLLILLPFLWAVSDPFAEVFLTVFLLVDLFFILINGVPMRMGGIANDANNALMLRRDARSLGALAVQLRANALVQEGVRPRDMPLNWFETEGDIDYRNQLQVGVALMKAGRLIDLEQWDDAYREHEMLYGHKEEIMPLYVREIECELLFLALVTGRMAQARELYGSDSLRSYIGNYRRIMSSKERLLFAVALFMEEDHGKAAGILDQVGSHRNDYLMQGEVKSDLAIMESLLANVKKRHG